MLAAIALLPTACAGAQDVTPSGPPVDGGRLTIGVGTAIDCFDPQVSPSDETAAVMRNVYDSLVKQKADGTFTPWLATSWNISPDAATYTFHLRQGVVFHDGTPFDAAAVKANFDRIVDPRTASQYARTLIGPYAGTDVVDAKTVVVRLASPYSPFLQAVSTTNLGFHSPTSIASHDNLCPGGTRQVGTGPFTFDAGATAEGFTLNRNAAYAWSPDGDRPGPAHLDSVDYRILPESTVRVGSLISGEVDVIDQIATTDIDTLKTIREVEVHDADPTGIPYTYFFNTTRAPFADERFRQAISSGIDLAGLTKSIFGGTYTRALSPLSPATLPIGDVGGGDGYDRAAAEKALDDLGYAGRDGDGYRTRDGRRLTLALIYDPTYQKSERIVFDTAVQDALRKIGVQLTLTAIGNGSYIEVRNAGNYDVIGFGWGGGDPDVLRTIYGSASQFTDGGANAARVRDASLDGLLSAGLRTTDRASRAQIYEAAQRRITATRYGLPVYLAPVTTAHRHTVMGLAYATDSTLPVLHDAWIPAR